MEVTNQNAEPTSPPQPYVGFYNIGNTCYLNSVLQTLRYSPHFVTALKDMLHLAEEWLEQRDEDGVIETEDSGKDGGSRDREVEEEENMTKTRQLLSEMYKVRLEENPGLDIFLREATTKLRSERRVLTSTFAFALMLFCE